MRQRARLLLVLALGPGLLAGQQPDAESLRANVVRVTGVSGSGFGFIVGLEDHAFLIATPWHVVTADADSTPTVCFLPSAGGCRRGRVVYLDDPVDAVDRGLDLAVVRVGYPDGIVWRPDVFGPPPQAGKPVLFIGRSGDWYIPPRPGTITGTDPATGLLQYRDLPVAAGVSGAPIIVAGAIVAMHVSSNGTVGQGIPIDQIVRRIRERMRAISALVAPASCDSKARTEDDLEGESLRVHFAWNRPERALDAIARIRCLHVTAHPIPEWRATTTAPGITYPRGGLRAARLLQATLLDVTVLDARLGSGTEIEIWMP